MAVVAGQLGSVSLSVKLFEKKLTGSKGPEVGSHESVRLFQPATYAQS